MVNTCFTNAYTFFLSLINANKISYISTFNLSSLLYETNFEISLLSLTVLQNLLPDGQILYTLTNNAFHNTR